MRSLVPRPVLLVLVLFLVVGAIAFVELRFDADAPVSADTVQNPGPPVAKEKARAKSTAVEKTPDTATDRQEKPTHPTRATEDRGSPEPAVSDADRIAKKEDEYRRAGEITAPSGFINADGFSVREAAGEKVILLEFWTYTCSNCQNVQPHMNAWHDAYADEGLQVVGVHTPEFGFEKEYANVAAAVEEAGIEYPVVLDNSYATWEAYDQRFWPAVYLIDADGFVRHKHFGEGAYGETEQKIEDLLAEKDRISG